MQRTILVPVDRSAFAEAAVPYAALMARRSGATLHFVEVQTLLTAETAPGLPVTIDAAFVAEIEFQAETWLRDLADRVSKEHGVETRWALLQGAVVPALDAYAREEGVDLIVMSTHGRGGLRRAWLGSVADRLIRHVTVPVLLIRPAEAAMPAAPDAFRNIVVGLDGSPIAEHALDAAMTVAAHGVTRITLARIAVAPLHINSSYLPDAARTQREEEARARQEAEEYLAVVAARIRPGWNDLETRVVTAYQTAGALLDLAATESADLIVVGTHGRGPITRAFLGSVADKVIRGSRKPTLVKRPLTAKGKT
jgi:nucleotide-binding universal stress UspA family protein